MLLGIEICVVNLLFLHTQNWLHIQVVGDQVALELYFHIKTKHCLETEEGSSGTLKPYL